MGGTIKLFKISKDATYKVNPGAEWVVTGEGVAYVDGKSFLMAPRTFHGLKELFQKTNYTAIEWRASGRKTVIVKASDFNKGTKR